jgi:hypothetical protein
VCVVGVVYVTVCWCVFLEKKEEVEYFELLVIIIYTVLYIVSPVMKSGNRHLIKSVNQSADLEPLSFFEGIFAYVTLGCICGCVQLCLLLFPFFLILSIMGYRSAMFSMALYIILTVYPIHFGKPWGTFIHSWIFDVSCFNRIE